MQLRWIASFGIFGVSLAAFASQGCTGNTAYIGDTTSPADGGSSGTVDPGRSSSDAGQVAMEAGVVVDAAAPTCASWGGQCRKASDPNAPAAPLCGGDQLTVSGRGCSDGEVCCAPTCYPTTPGCPAGMQPSPDPNVPCGVGMVNCIAVPTSPCELNGGLCGFENPSALVEVCVGMSRVVGAFACGNPKDVCCLPQK